MSRFCTASATGLLAASAAKLDNNRMQSAFIAAPPITVRSTSRCYLQPDPAARRLYPGWSTADSPSGCRPDISDDGRLSYARRLRLPRTPAAAHDYEHC